jgi:YVTN family beta-propeller protein
MKSNVLFRFLTIGALAFSVTLQSCKDDEGDGPAETTYTNGVFIVNEGPFQSGTGSVSFWSRNNATRQADVYNTVNSIPLGNVVQSLTLAYGKGYVVVNNANKIEVVNGSTFKSDGTITGLALPRYFVAANAQTGYVTEWVSFSGNGRVSVINLATNEVTTSITVGALPDKMLLHENKLYVVNSNGTTVSVINTQTNQLESPITVGDWPSDIQLDQNGDIWVLCGGVPSWTGSTATSPSLVKFNPAAPTSQTTLDFGTPDNSPSRLTINGQGTKLYYLYNGGVYEHAISAGTLSSSPIINRNFYGLGVDPVDGFIYGADAVDFTQSGKVIKYNTSNTPVDSFTTAVAPSNFWFVN